jgi:hypothetical protein
MRAWWCAWALLASVGAWAGEPARCKVQMVHALEGVGGIDARLERLKPYLEKPPFTSWKKFVLLEEKASLTYVDHLPRDPGRHRLRLKLAIADGDKKVLETVLVLDEGGVFLQAGQKLQTGLLVLAFSCLTAS